MGASPSATPSIAWTIRPADHGSIRRSAFFTTIRSIGGNGGTATGS
ncbi:MAG: hypothetical protein IPM87_11410 [Novosphingobium sp.]|nr:hypothetical protein [Novosphingobium sp.]MBK9011265.1 hypothetical protein [Novosphingobium sp.]